MAHEQEDDANAPPDEVVRAAFDSAAMLALCKQVLDRFRERKQWYVNECPVAWYTSFFDCWDDEAPRDLPADVRSAVYHALEEAYLMARGHGFFNPPPVDVLRSRWCTRADVLAWLRAEITPEMADVMRARP